MRSLLLLILMSVFMSGCAIGNTYRYDLGDAQFNLNSDKTVAVTTLDLRPYVRSGDKSPTFVGLMRGGFGNPFDVLTSSGRPLAEDMTISIVEALKKSDIKAFGVTAPAGANRSDTQDRLLQEDADRFVLFLILEWKTDTFFNTGLIHNVTLQVLHRDGSRVAEKTLQGRDNLGVAGLPKDARVKAEKAFREKLEAIFNDPEVASAFP